MQFHTLLAAGIKGHFLGSWSFSILGTDKPRLAGRHLLLTPARNATSLEGCRASAPQLRPRDLQQKGTRKPTSPGSLHESNYLVAAF